MLIQTGHKDILHTGHKDIYNTQDTSIDIYITHWTKRYVISHWTLGYKTHRTQRYI